MSSSVQMIAPAKDNDGRVMDEDWLATVTEESGGITELLEMPPKSIAASTDEYLVAERLVHEVVLSALALEVTARSNMAPAYIWQIIANRPRKNVEKLTEFVHDETWQMFKRQNKMIVDRRNSFNTSIALRLSFMDFKGTWTENPVGWDTFFTRFRVNLAKVTFPELDIHWAWPICGGCKSDDPVFKTFMKGARPELSCLENWLRRWITSNNTLTYRSAFPELQVKVWTIKQQYRTGKALDVHQWMDVFREKYPEVRPDSSILQMEPADLVPADWR